jgi:hypothetical protein
LTAGGVHNRFGAGKKPAFSARKPSEHPQTQGDIMHFDKFEKMHVYKDL